MSKWEKLIDKVTSMSKDMRFQEIKKILEGYGYTGNNPSGGSSHWTFRKKGKAPITIPKDNPINWHI